MSKFVPVTAAVALALLAACTASEPENPALNSTQGLQSSAGVCAQVFQRQRTCTESFIPALVDLRVELDTPAGIAAAAKAQGRAALIAEALEEWKADSTDEAVAKTCERLAGSGPGAAMLDSAARCLSAIHCGDFNGCILPVLKQAMSGAPDARQSCTRLFERQRACTDTFIPALVDLRVALDVPRGITAAAKAKGRAALVSEALREWKADSTDAAIDRTCEGLSASPRAEAVTSVATRCLPLSGCGQFVECITPSLRAQLSR